MKTIPITVEPASLSSPEDSPAGISPLITVKRLDSLKNYDQIKESDEESRSSFNTSRSANSSELRRLKELKESNIFLMKVIHGNVPNELLASRITSTDRENLSTLIPVFGSRDATV
mmetsp:Transcript_13497/g.18488  ORF Transcript_13497/g.18488 Transcript_13497/m.18488 type:complete len:116 (+) Transcript_13497:1648-1995(+)